MSATLPSVARPDLVGTAELIRQKVCSAPEIVEQAIARIERLNPTVNAVIHRRFEEALSELKAGEIPAGPFQGVPFLIKDLHCHTAGDPYYSGMRVLRDADWRATVDSWLAGRFRAGGLVFLGRTNTPEIGLSATTEPLSYGPTKNPWDLSRSPGGSSGGSAAAVAAGMVPAAHANDGAGSTRIPASACGLVGLKPSRGRVSRAPSPDLLGSACELAVSRSVRDTAALLDWVSVSAPGDPSLPPPPAGSFAKSAEGPVGRMRVGMMVESPGGRFPVDPVAKAAVEGAAQTLQSLGHLVEIAHPAALDELPLEHPTWIVNYGARLDEWSEKLGRELGREDVEPLVWAVAQEAHKESAPSFLRWLGFEQLRARRTAEWWPSEQFDLLLTPTLPCLPPRLGTLDPDPADPFGIVPKLLAMVCFVMPFNATGQPAITVPVHWDDSGLPVGVQLVADHHREDVLLGVAQQMEDCTEWLRRPEPLIARDAAEEVGG